MIKEIKQHGDNVVVGARERDDSSLSRRVSVSVRSCVNLHLQKRMPRWDTEDKGFIMQMSVCQAIRKKSERLAWQLQGHANLIAVMGWVEAS